MLEEMGKGFSSSESERMVIALMQRIVEGLRDEERISVKDTIKEIRETFGTAKSSRIAEPVSVAQTPDERG